MTTFKELCQRHGFDAWTSKQTGEEIVQTHITEKQLIAIQRDALLEAAKIAAKASENLTMYYGAVCARDAILARANEVEAQPHSTDEKKI